MKTQVLVIGAGPVGLTLAIDLGLQGIDVVLVERKPEPEFLPKMERCNARTMEIFRRIGLSEDIRKAGLDKSVSMDVYIVKSMTEKPLLRLEYPSVEEVTASIAKSTDTSEPSEAYQLISQYTLEPLLKQVAESIPSIKVMYGHEFVKLQQDDDGVTTSVRSTSEDDGELFEIRADYLAGCDGGGSRVRRAIGIELRGESNILELRQALYRCDELFDLLPIKDGPGHGRHYHVADGQASFLIMQDSTRHWTLHAVVEKDEDMATLFEKIVGVPVNYEMLYVGKWKQNLMLADRYCDGRVFLAGDSAHLVIPTGGLGMNTGVGDAIDLSWKLAGTLSGWGGPKLLDSYEVERRQVGDRNIGASRYASLGRRKWRSKWAEGFEGNTAKAASLQAELTMTADIEQRKTNEMIGAELGYRYVDSPVIWDEPGGPEQRFRHYDPTAWTGVRLPHVWLTPGKSINDTIGRSYALLRMGPDAPETEALATALRETGAPVEEHNFPDERYRQLYGVSCLLVRPDLHIVWRGDELPENVQTLARVVTGKPVDNMSRTHAKS